MDPNETLMRLLNGIRCARSQMTADTDHPRYSVVDNETVALIADSAESLHEWLSRGGFLPMAWERA